jgi:phosphoglycerate dehydrogenase-like enzyme
MTEDELCRELQGVDAVLAGNERFSERVLREAKDLKIVARVGAGYENVDLAAATRLGVWVTNTPDATTHAVAEYTIAVMLCWIRGIPAMLSDMKAGVWKQFLGKELRCLTIGIIGAGRIGRQAATLARAFGAQVLVFDVAPDEAFAQGLGIEYASLEQLLAESDIVSVHCALNDQTRGLINKTSLGMMKSGALLVNTSRPGVVVKDDLVEALASGRIAGAAIDVHDPKPAPPGDPLVGLANVLATPWSAGYTDSSVEAMIQDSSRDVVRVLQGKAPRFPLNRPERPRG